MANRIDFSVGYNVDQGSLNKVKASLQQLQKLTAADLKLGTGTEAKKQLDDIKKSASQVESALKKAFNANLGTVNISKFNTELKKLDLNKIYSDFSKAGVAGQQAFKNVTTEILTTNMQLKQTHSFIDNIATTMSNTIKWGAASSVMNAFTGIVQQAWGYVKGLDDSLNDIRIVTNKSAEEMDKFAEKANKAAQNLGKGTKDYTNASLIYYQQGLSDEEVAARTAVTMKAANVTGQTGAEVSEQLTAVWNGYKVTAAEAELYVDKLAAVAASTASDLEELSTGMSKVASAANSMGVDVDQLNAQLATIVSVTRQAPESVGTALKTIYARMGDLKIDGEDEFGTKLGDVSGKMQQMGVEVLDQTGNLRDMGEVIEEVAGKWDTWTESQKQAAAVAMAGKRQYNNLIALFDNWDMYTDALNKSQNALGTLQKQQDIYLERTSTKLQQLGTAWENVYDSLIDPKELNGLIEIFTKLTNGVATFIDSIGGGSTVLLALGSIATQVLSKQMSEGLMKTIENFQNAKYNAEQLNATFEITQRFKGIDINDEGTQQLIRMKEQVLLLGDAVTEEQHNMANSFIQQTKDLQDQQTQWEETKKKAESFYEIVTGNKIDFSSLSVGSSKLKELENDLKETSEEFKQLGISARDLKKLISSVSQTSSELFNDKSDEAIKRLNEAYNTLHQEMTGYKDKAHELLKEHLLEENEANALREALQKLQTARLQASRTDGTYNLGEQLINNAEVAAAGQNFLQIMDGIMQTVQGRIKETRNVATQEANGASTDLQNALDNIKNEYQKKIEDIQKQSFTEGIIKSVGAVGQLASAIKSLQNLGSIWNNDDLTTGEKITQTITNLAFVIPSLFNAYKTLNTNLGKKIILNTAEAALEKKQIALKKQHAAELALERQAQAHANAELAQNNALKLQNIALEKQQKADKLNFTDETLEIEIMQANTAAQQANAEARLAREAAEKADAAVAAANTDSVMANKIATDAQTKSILAQNAAWLANPVAAVITGIVAAIAVAAVVIGFIDKVQKQQAETALKKAEEQLKMQQELTETYQQEKENVDKLVESYQSLAQQYNNHEITIENLRLQTYDLCQQYEQEDLAILSLAADYDTLTKSMLQAQEAANNKVAESATREKEYLSSKILATQNKQNVDRNPFSRMFSGGNEAGEQALEFHTWGTSKAEKDFFNGLKDIIGFSENIEDHKVDFSSDEILKNLSDRWQDVQIYMNSNLELSEHSIYKTFDQFFTSIEADVKEYGKIYDENLNAQMSNLVLDKITLPNGQQKDLSKLKDLQNVIQEVIDEASELNLGTTEELEKWLISYFSKDSKTAYTLNKNKIFEAFKTENEIENNNLRDYIDNLSNEQINNIVLHLDYKQANQSLQDFENIYQDALDGFQSKSKIDLILNVITQATTNHELNTDDINNLFNGQDSITVGGELINRVDFEGFNFSKQLKIIEQYLKEQTEINRTAVANGIDELQSASNQYSRELNDLNEKKKSTIDEIKTKVSNFIVVTNNLKVLNSYVPESDEEEAIFNTINKYGDDQEAQLDAILKLIEIHKDTNDGYEKALKSILGEEKYNQYVQLLEQIKTTTEKAENTAKDIVQLQSTRKDPVLVAKMIAEKEEAAAKELQEFKTKYQELITIQEKYNEVGYLTAEQAETVTEFEEKYGDVVSYVGDQMVIAAEKADKYAQSLRKLAADQLETAKGEYETARSDALVKLGTGNYHIADSEKARLNQIIRDATAQIDAIEAEQQKRKDRRENRSKIGTGNGETKTETVTHETINVDEYEYYNKLLEDSEERLKRIQKEKEGLTGIALVEKIKEENEELNKQLQIYNDIKNKAENNVNTTKTNVESLNINGTTAQFDENGNVSNIVEMRQAIADQIEALNSSNEEDKKKIEIYKNYLQYLDDYEVALKKYNGALSDITNTQATIAQNEEAIYKAKAGQFDYLITNEQNKRKDNNNKISKLDTDDPLNNDKILENLREEHNLLEENKQSLADENQLLQEKRDIYAQALVDAQKGREDEGWTKEDYISNLQTAYEQYAIARASGDEQAIADAEKLVNEATKLYDNASPLLGLLDDTNDKIKQNEEDAEKLADALEAADLALDSTMANMKITGIDRDLKNISRELKAVQRANKGLEGQALIDNLRKQQEIIKKQIQAEQKKAAIKKALYQTEMAIYKVKLMEMAADMGLVQIEFDKTTGAIKNFEALLNDVQKKAGNIAEKDFNTFMSMLTSYQTLLSDFDSLLDPVLDAQWALEDIGLQIQSEYDKLAEKAKKAAEDAAKAAEEEMNRRLTQFKLTINVKLELREAMRQWNEYKNRIKYGKDSALGSAMNAYENYSTYYNKGGQGGVQLLTGTVNRIMQAVNTIHSGDVDDIYGEDIESALSDLDKYRAQLQDQLNAVLDLYDQAYEAYTKQLDKISNKFAEQIQVYEKISSIIQHDMNIIKMLYGDDAYDKLDKYYQRSNENNLEKLEELRRQMEMWKAKRDSAEFGSDEWELYNKNYQDVMSQMNDALENSLKGVIDKYKNTISAVFADLEKHLTDGKGFQTLQDEWDRMNDSSSLYLDNVNKLFAIQDLQSKFQKSIDETDNLSAQQALTKLMEEQLDILKNKEKVSQYDVDRANKLYEIELKRLALEEAKNNKSKMRLRRDSQGNYTYQFTADQDKVNAADDELRKAQNDLYNMDLEEYKKNEEKIFKLKQEFIQKAEKIAQDNTLSRVEKEQQIRDLQAQYENDMLALSKDNAWIRQNLAESAIAALGDQSKYTLEEFRNLSKEAQDEFMGELVPQWNSGIQAMIDMFSAEGGLGPEVDAIMEQIIEATRAYEEEIAAIEGAARVSFEAIVNGLDPAIEQTHEIIEVNEELIAQYEEELEEIEKVMEALQKMQEEYAKAQAAAEQAILAAIQLAEELAGTLNALKDVPDDVDGSGSSSSSSSSSSGNGSGTGNNNSNNNGSGDKDKEKKIYYVYFTKKKQPKNETEEADREKGYGIVMQEVQDYTNEVRSGGSRTTQSEFLKRLKNKYDYTKWWNAKWSTTPIPWGDMIELKTGGYTGSWGQDGKMAVLHEKELVLNKTDTQNILDAVQLLRNLDNIPATLTALTQGIMSGALLSVNSPMPISSTPTIDQNVHIEATFPNVNVAKEIEDAFNNLLNIASQHAMNTQR